MRLNSPCAKRVSPIVVAASLLLAATISACTSTTECEFNDIEMTNGAEHVLFLQTCTTTARVLSLTAADSSPRELSVGELIPTAVAVAADRPIAYVAGYDPDGIEKGRGAWKVVRQSIDPEQVRVVIRQSELPIRSMITAGSERLVYQLQTDTYQSGRPMFHWYYDNFGPAPQRLSEKAYGHLLGGNSIQGRGILFNAPQDTRGNHSINQLVWEGFSPGEPRPEVAIKTVSNKTYTVTCSPHGDVCLEATAAAPRVGTSRYQSEITVHRFGKRCSSGPIAEDVTRLSIAPDGGRAAYVGGDLVDGKGGQINPRLVLIDLSGPSCVRELRRINLTGGK